MNKFKKSAAALCTAVSLFSTLSFSVSATPSAEQMNCPDYTELCNQTFDDKVFYDTVDKINKIVENNETDKSDDVKQLMETLVNEYIHIETLYNIYDTEYYTDSSDSKKRTRYENISAAEIDVYNKLSDCIVALCDIGYEKLLTDICGYNLVDTFSYDSENIDEHNEYTEKNDEILTQCNDLVSEYYSFSENDFAVEYNGELWTTSMLINDTSLSDEEYSELAGQIHDKRNETLGSIYTDLVKLRNQLAQLNGYDNYAVYAYENLFLRDYTYEDAGMMYDYVKNDFRPVYSLLQDAYNDSVIDSGLAVRNFSKEYMLETMKNFLGDFNSSYLDNYDHMISHHLLNISPDDTLNGNAFTSSLYEYSVPYVYISQNHDYSDILTLAHEFGHANAEYQNPNDAIYNVTSIDTCEMHSQGLEILFADYAKNVLDEKQADALTKSVIANIADSVIQGCLFDEFQRYAYENPDCTLEQLNNKYEQLCSDYGIDFCSDDPYCFDWVEIAHNYDSPMYYIAYATSAVSILDLWITSQYDIGKAWEIYENISATDSYIPYVQAAEECGIASFFDTSKLKNITYQLNYYLNNNTVDKNYSPSDEPKISAHTEITSDTNSKTNIFIFIFAGIGAVIIISVTALIIKNKK